MFTKVAFQESSTQQPKWWRQLRIEDNTDDVAYTNSDTTASSAAFSTSSSNRFNEISQRLGSSYTTHKSNSALAGAKASTELAERMAASSVSHEMSVCDSEDEDATSAAKESVLSANEIETLLSKRLLPIPAVEQRRVKEILEGPPTGDMLTDKFSMHITRKDLKRLDNGCWLNDEIINFYIEMLKERDSRLSTSLHDRISSHYFHSIFYMKLMENGVYNYANVRRWTKKVDIFSKHKVFFPINLNNNHWVLAVAHIVSKTIVYYDSFAGNGVPHLRNLLKWLADEYDDKKKMLLDTSEWILIGHSSDVPRQENGFDCGMFALTCADYLSDDLPLRYSQQEMRQRRINTAAFILRGNIPY